jgi:hypothetical protein
MSSESSFMQKEEQNSVVRQAFSGIMAHTEFPFNFTATDNFMEI